MKKQREFLSELYHSSKMPFVKCFQEDKYLRNKLFTEYLKTELQPNLKLYKDKYLADKEIEKENIERIKKIPEDASLIKTIGSIQNVVYKKVTEKSLEKKYYSHQLDKTEISTKLTLVHQIIEGFKTKILQENKFNIKQYSDEMLKGLIGVLESIQIPELTKLILYDFVNDQENIVIDIHCHSNKSNKKEIEQKYRELKSYADNYISEYLKNFDNIKDENKERVQFKNNFDQVEPNRVYQYFFDSLVKPKYIDESILKDYLIAAFQDKQELQQRITIRNKVTNKKVQEVFYIYYKDIAGKPYGKQQEYIKLLGNYFVGFDTEKLKTNFSKTY